MKKKENVKKFILWFFIFIICFIGISILMYFGKLIWNLIFLYYEFCTCNFTGELSVIVFFIPFIILLSIIGCVYIWFEIRDIYQKYKIERCDDEMCKKEINYKLLFENALVLGKDVNKKQTCEECAELTAAILKYNRTLGDGQKTEVDTDTAYNNVLDELADVYICIEQFVILNDCKDDVIERINKALNKVDKRYREEKNDKKSNGTI